MRRVQVPISKHSQTAIWWTCQSSSKKNNTTSSSTSHGQELRNLAKVPYWQCTCPSRSAHLLGMSGHGNISIPPLRTQNYSTIRLLTLRVKFDGISRRTLELEHLPWTAFIRCIWNILFPIKAPFAKKCSSSDLCIFCLLSSTKSVPMYLVTCWKYKQSHISISPCRNDPSQLQNCEPKIFTIYGTFFVLWRHVKNSSTRTPQKRIFCLFFASSNVLSGLIREAHYSVKSNFMHYEPLLASKVPKKSRIGNQIWRSISRQKFKFGENPRHSKGKKTRRLKKARPKSPTFRKTKRDQLPNMGVKRKPKFKVKSPTAFAVPDGPIGYSMVLTLKRARTTFISRPDASIAAEFSHATCPVRPATVFSRPSIYRMKEQCWYIFGMFLQWIIPKIRINYLFNQL